MGMTAILSTLGVFVAQCLLLFLLWFIFFLLPCFLNCRLRPQSCRDSLTSRSPFIIPNAAISPSHSPSESHPSPGPLPRRYRLRSLSRSATHSCSLFPRGLARPSWPCPAFSLFEQTPASIVTDEVPSRQPQTPAAYTNKRVAGSCTGPNTSPPLDFDDLTWPSLALAHLQVVWFFISCPSGPPSRRRHRQPSKP